MTLPKKINNNLVISELSQHWCYDSIHTIYSVFEFPHGPLFSVAVYHKTFSLIHKTSAVVGFKGSV